MRLKRGLTSAFLVLAVLAADAASFRIRAQARGGGAAGPDEKTAAARLRALYYAQDFEGCSVEGEKQGARFPDALEMRTWTILAESRHASAYVAAAEARKMIAAHPENPWGWMALGGALSSTVDGCEEALQASKKAWHRSPTDPDLLALRARVLSNCGKLDDAVALVDEHASEVRNPAELLVIKADVQYRRSRDEKTGEQRPAEALGTFAEARRIDPADVNAHVRAAELLISLKRFDEAYPLLKKAVSLAPFSTRVHEWYWSAVMGREEIPAAKRQAEVTADLRGLLKARGGYPGTLRAAADEYGGLHQKSKQKELEERILRDHPDSVEAELLLEDRWDNLAKEAWEAGVPIPAKQKQLQAMLRGFIRRPRHVQQFLLFDAYQGLFYSVKDDPSVGDDELLDAIRGMLQNDRWNADWTFSESACALADRKTHLEEAEQIVRDGLVRVREQAPWKRQLYHYSKRKEKLSLKGHRGELVDALGWIHLAGGHLEQAEPELTRARTMLGENARNLYHLGRLYEEGADYDRAEGFYVRGMAVQTPERSLSVKAIRDLYVKRHGSAEGLEAYLAKFQTEQGEQRRREILAERAPLPPPIPAFDLQTLSGKRISLASLKGKVVVINFWGVWCSACVGEMPDFQKLHEQYRNDPDVAILTIDTDPDPDSARDWMKKKKYDFAVLVDDGYVGKAGVLSFPTTWFVDREGRRAFIENRSSQELQEEFGWRIEALKQDGSS